MSYAIDTKLLHNSHFQTTIPIKKESKSWIRHTYIHEIVFIIHIHIQYRILWVRMPIIHGKRRKAFKVKF